MKKKLIIIIPIIVIALIITILIGYKALYDNNIILDNNIPDNYIAIFQGGSGEITYSTYIYKINNHQANYEFEYINTVNTTKSWGSTEWETKVVKKGKFNWTDNAFDVAKENNAYSYVELPNKQIVTIEEFQTMFLMN